MIQRRSKSTDNNIFLHVLVGSISTRGDIAVAEEEHWFRHPVQTKGVLSIATHVLWRAVAENYKVLGIL